MYQAKLQDQISSHTRKLSIPLNKLPLNPPRSKSGRKFHDDYENASNSISNSVAESDSIDAESGFEDIEIPDRGQNVIKFVSRFADKVCSESSVTEDHIKAINQMIPGTIIVLFIFKGMQLRVTNFAENRVAAKNCRSLKCEPPIQQLQAHLGQPKS